MTRSTCGGGLERGIEVEGVADSALDRLADAAEVVSDRLRGRERKDRVPGVERDLGECLPQEGGPVLGGEA